MQKIYCVQQSPDSYGYVRNALNKTNDESVHGISLIIFDYFQKDLVFKWTRNITNISQCLLHEFLYVLKLGIDSLNNNKQTSIHRQIYSAKDLLTLAIKNDIDGKRFKELNKYEDNIIY